MFLNDAFYAGIGLNLLAIGMTACYVAAMLLGCVEFMAFNVSDVGSTEGVGLVWVLFIVVPLLMATGAVLFWTTLQVVRSSQKAIFVCFVQVISAC